MKCRADREAPERNILLPYSSGKKSKGSRILFLQELVYEVPEFT